MVNFYTVKFYIVKNYPIWAFEIFFKFLLGSTSDLQGHFKFQAYLAYKFCTI
jgi:hypothetical protein